MSRALNLKYRPKTFEEVTGQTLTTTILKRLVETRNFKNVYLFAGKTGSGKTTCARIFANEINHGVGTPIEIDAASNNGVDQVRAIIEAANQRSLTGEYKIYIIDECHAITTAGWQAFLKGIEEPPMYTIFIFCTTEPTKIPQTVLNRMQRYNFSAISTANIKARLEYICEQESFINYKETCDLISKISQGCMRDAITYLEQCADFSTDLSIENTKKILGDFSYETMFKLTWAIKDKDESAILSTVENIAGLGQDLKHFVDLYLEFCLDLVKFIYFKDITLTGIPAYLATAENAVVQFTVDGAGTDKLLLALVDSLLELKLNIKYDNTIAATIEAYLLRFVRGFSK